MSFWAAFKKREPDGEVTTHHLLVDGQSRRSGELTKARCGSEGEVGYLIEYKTDTEHGFGTMRRCEGCLRIFRSEDHGNEQRPKAEGNTGQQKLALS